jgi:hypothetical protein
VAVDHDAVFVALNGKGETGCRLARHSVPSERETDRGEIVTYCDPKRKWEWAGFFDSVLGSENKL